MRPGGRYTGLEQTIPSESPVSSGALDRIYSLALGPSCARVVRRASRSCSAHSAAAFPQRDRAASEAPTSNFPESSVAI